MAVQKVPKESTIAVKLQKGISATGSPVYVTRNYPCKPSVVDQDIFDVAVALSGLQSHPVASVQRIDTAEMMNA